MGCHRSQRSSSICESVYFVFLALLFLEFLPGRTPGKEKVKEAA